MLDPFADFLLQSNIQETRRREQERLAQQQAEERAQNKATADKLMAEAQRERDRGRDTAPGDTAASASHPGPWRDDLDYSVRRNDEVHAFLSALGPAVYGSVLNRVRRGIEPGGPMTTKTALDILLDTMRNLGEPDQSMHFDRDWVASGPDSVRFFCALLGLNARDTRAVRDEFGATLYERPWIEQIEFLADHAIDNPIFRSSWASRYIDPVEKRRAALERNRDLFDPSVDLNELAKDPDLKWLVGPAATVDRRLEELMSKPGYYAHHFGPGGEPAQRAMPEDALNPFEVLAGEMLERGRRERM
jgi:hypothetical protein